MESASYMLKQAVSALNRSDSGEEASRLERHIRHWTSLDLISPAGAKHTGTGRRREYTVDQVRRAAVLEELSKWRVPVTVLADNFQSFTDDFEHEWATAVNGRAAVYLVLTWTDQVSVWNLTIGQPGLAAIQDDENSRQDHPVNDGFDFPASAIVINLTRILRWIKF